MRTPGRCQRCYTRCERTTLQFLATRFDSSEGRLPKKRFGDE
jgi:hypothetical protein